MSGISFKSDRYKLIGNMYIPDKSHRNMAFLFIQGWVGVQNLHAAQAVAQLGYTTMTYDMRGNGGSEGKLVDASPADFIKDAVAAYDYLQHQVGAEVPISVVGDSFGAYTAALLSTQRDIYSLSLRVPANYPDNGYAKPRPFKISAEDKEWRKEKVDYIQNKALAAIHKFRGKIQIIEAGSDEVIAHQTPRNYANAIANKSLLTYEVVLGAPHTLVNDQLSTDYTDRLLAWVKRLT